MKPDQASGLRARVAAANAGRPTGPYGWAVNMADLEIRQADGTLWAEILGPADEEGTRVILGVIARRLNGDYFVRQVNP